MLREPAYAQADFSLRKSFSLIEDMKLTVGVETFNLLNHPDLSVPSNTQSPLTPGGNGDAVFKDAAGDFADNPERTFSTVGAARQFELSARFAYS
jgi:hypothetical protein